MRKLQESEEKQKERGEKGNIQAKYSIVILNTVAVDLWGCDQNLCLPPFCVLTIVHLPLFK